MIRNNRLSALFTPAPLQKVTAVKVRGFIFLYAILIIFLDQLAKFIACGKLLPSQSIPVVKSIFHITLVFNKGAAFGIFANAASVFIFISVFVILFISVFLFTPTPKILAWGFIKRDMACGIKVAFASIMSGALSNLIDRLRFGYVIDFLDFRIWPVFNIADSAITLGTIWLCIRFFLKSGR